jgi:hypothetical protein
VLTRQLFVRLLPPLLHHLMRLAVPTLHMQLLQLLLLLLLLLPPPL